MAKVLMVQGTMSNVGKSVLTAGLCRIFRRDGHRPAPFKSQNMALNSFITEDGLEMGRAQVMQAEAAGRRPEVWMNPVLLKPTTDSVSQVIVNGRVAGNMDARTYFARKRELVPDILRAFRALEQTSDIIVIEGAGSPAEINLRDNDIVNMGLAAMVDAPVILVGNIDPGGVFAQLLGTLEWMTPEERSRVGGLVINKFRGDVSLLEPGIRMLEERCGIPVLGVVPYLDISLEDEDSLTGRFGNSGDGVRDGGLDLAVIRFPRISNFTDFNVFDTFPDVHVRYVRNPGELGKPDMILLPGSKNTIGDLQWLRESGFAERIEAAAGSIPIFGICGGLQMLGESIADPGHVESETETAAGLGLLPIHTVMVPQKTRRQTSGTVGPVSGLFKGLTGLPYEGYEIHMGVTEDHRTVLESAREADIYGTYVHGFFDRKEIAAEIVRALSARRGCPVSTDGVRDYRDFRQQQYDLLADALEESLDMRAVYGMLREVEV